MFNALNRFISRLDGDSSSQREGPGSYGFQVLRNTNPDLAIEPWYDFVVGINGRMIDNPSAPLFAQEVRNCAGSTVSLSLWSAKGQRTRTLHVPVPHPSSSSTSTSTGDGSLGLTLQWTPLSLATNVWHVLDVPPNSPADLAGLLPFSDYILGEAPTSLTTMADIATAPAADSAAGSGPASTSTATTTVLLHGEAGLGELVEDHLGRPLRLWVYNVEYDATREVEVVPSREWGGEGALGCVLGYGALHRLPPPLSEPVEAPGETMFDGGGGSVAGGGSGGFGSFGGFDAGSGGEYNEKTGAFIPTTAQVPNPAADFLVPAQLVAATASTTPPPSTSGGPTRGKKKDRHHAPHGGAGAGLMDDYFREEEEKSKRLDNAPSKVRPGIAPPPRAGGPPKAATTTASPPPQTQADEANTDAA